jgi:hypothetical protein
VTINAHTHFSVSGNKADLYDRTNPDLAPSLKLGPQEEESQSATLSSKKRYERTRTRDERKTKFRNAQALLDLQSSQNEMSDEEAAETGCSGLPYLHHSAKIPVRMSVVLSFVLASYFLSEGNGVRHASCLLKLILLLSVLVPNNISRQMLLDCMMLHQFQLLPHQTFHFVMTVNPTVLGQF